MFVTDLDLFTIGTIIVITHIELIYNQSSY
jgi:hypothetical protein